MPNRKGKNTLSRSYRHRCTTSVRLPAISTVSMKNLSVYQMTRNVALVIKSPRMSKYKRCASDMPLPVEPRDSQVFALSTFFFELRISISRNKHCFRVIHITKYRLQGDTGISLYSGQLKLHHLQGSNHIRF